MENKEMMILLRSLEQEPEFVDYKFPANIQSLIKGSDEKSYKGEWNGVKWKKLGQIKMGKLTLTRNIDPNTLSYGKVQIRNLLEVFGVLACRKDLVNRIIEIKDPRCNLLAVWLFIDGKWTLVHMDPLFPIYGINITSRFVFCYDKEDDSWPSILEKAYAKTLGSYFKLFISNPIFTLQHFTGLPIEKVSTFDLKELWSRIKDGVKKENFIVCSLKVEAMEEHFVIADYHEDLTYKLLKIKNGYK